MKAGLLTDTWTQLYCSLPKEKLLLSAQWKYPQSCLSFRESSLNWTMSWKRMFFCMLLHPITRTVTFLSFSSASRRGAGWYKLQQQFSGVMHAVVSEKFGKSVSGAPVLFSFPKGKMVLIAIEPGPAKEMSNSRSSYVSLYHFPAPRYGYQWCLCSSTSIREGKLAEPGWGGQKREGNLCALLPLAPGDSLCLHWACLSSRTAGREEVGVKL